MLINKKAVRTVALHFSEKYRNGKFTRVSGKFLEKANAHLTLWIKSEVERHPSIGKTII
jgi:hypothetical protein